MKKPLKILAIDDDEFSQHFIRKSISDQYEIKFAFNGKNGLQTVAEFKPDIILLDVEMPELDGYEVCRVLKHSVETKDIPVIFLSSYDSLQKRVKGFEAGGDDYMVKPLIPETIHAKISVLVKYKNRSKKLEAQVVEAEKTAYIAMNSSSELGLAMGMVEKSYTVGDYESLAQLMFEFTNRMQLNCSMLIRTNKEIICYSFNGVTPPLEAQLLTMLGKQNRIYDFGCRTHINFPSISLLIKNMPMNDMEKYGRIKDLIPSLLGAFDSKVRALNLGLAINQQSAELNKSFLTIKNTIQNLGRSLQENAKGGNLVLRNMLNELIQSLPGMALEDDQETYILDRIEFAITTTADITNAGDSISQSFETVISQLQLLVEKQDAIAESSIQIQAKQKTNASDQSDPDDSLSVELF